MDPCQRNIEVKRNAIHYILTIYIFNQLLWKQWRVLSNEHMTKKWITSVQLVIRRTEISDGVNLNSLRLHCKQRIFYFCLINISRIKTQNAITHFSIRFYAIKVRNIVFKRTPSQNVSDASACGSCDWFLVIFLQSV